MIRPLLVALLWITSLANVLTPTVAPVTEKGVWVAETQDPAYEAEIATLSTGDVVVVWFDSALFQLQGRFFTDTNPTVGSPTFLIYQAMSTHSVVFNRKSRDLAALSHGGFMVAYEDGNELYCREFDSNGSPMGAATHVSNFNTSTPHISDGHSILALGSGEVVLLFKGGTNASFFIVGGTGFAEETDLFQPTTPSVFDMVETPENKIVVAYATSVTNSTHYMILDSSFTRTEDVVDIDPGPSDGYLQIVFSRSYGRDPPLIILGMYSDSSSEFRLLNLNPITFNPTSESYADPHLALGLGSVENDYNIVLFNKESLDYLNKDFDPYPSPHDGSISHREVTIVSAAQLGQGGWFVIYIDSSSHALYATYQSVPEVRVISNDSSSISYESSARIDTGGRVFMYRSKTDNPLFYQFIKDGVLRQYNIIGYNSPDYYPRILGSLPNTDTFFVLCSPAEAQHQQKILRITIGSETPTVFLTLEGSTVVGQVCGNELRVVVVSASGKFEAHFSNKPAVHLFTDENFDSSRDSLDLACHGEKSVVVYTYRTQGDIVKYKEITEIGNPSDPDIHPVGSGGGEPFRISAHMFSDKSVLVFVHLSQPKYASNVYSFRIDSPDLGRWISIDYGASEGNVQPHAVSIAPSPVDDSIYVAFRLRHQFPGRSAEIAVGICHMDKFGTEISNSVNPILYNYYNFFVPSLITTPTGLSLAYLINDRIVVALLITKPVALDSGPEFSLSTRKGSQHSPESCSIGSDRVVIVWVRDSGEYSSIFGRIVETTEAPVGNKEFMISDPSSSHDQPSVACSEVGFYVTWQTSLASGVRVWVRQFDKDGVPSPPQTVGESAGKDARPDVATDKVGDKYVVVWQRNEDASTFEDIHMVPFTTSGKGSEVVVHITTDATQKSPSVAMDGTLIVVVWQSYGQDGSRYGVYGRTYNSADFTSREPVEFLINTVMLGCQSFPEVALFSDSRFIVTWASAAALFNVMAAVFDSDSAHTKVVPDFRVNVNTKGNHRPSSICVFDDDSFVVSWNYYLSRDVQDAYFRKFSSDMVPATEDVLINSHTPGKQFHSTVAVLNNIILVSWASEWQGGSTWSVYSRAFGKLETREMIGATLGGRIFVMPTSRTTSDGSVVTFFLCNFQGSTDRYPALSKTAPDGTKTEVRGGALTNPVSDSIQSFDVSVVGESGFMVLRDGTTYHFYKFSLDGVGNPTELSTSDVGVTAVPRLAAEGESEMAIVYRDGDDTVGASLFFQKYGDPLGTQISLFPEMQSFTHYDFEFLSGGHYVLANSMERVGVSGTKLCLSVVSTAGVVLKAVAITGSGANAYSPKIDVSGDKVVVCYAQESGSVFAAVECQLYVVSGLGGDITIKKQGGTLKTAMYASYPFVGMSVVGTDRFAVSGIMEDSVFVRVFNFAFECIGAHIVADDVRNLAGTSGFAVARYQVSGLSVTYGVSDANSSERIIQWLLKTPFYSSIDRRVPADPSVHPEYLGV